MMKNFYISAWILLALAAFVSVLTGTFNAVTLFVFSLVALALVYALALWSVVTQTRDLEAEHIGAAGR
jgi:ABC-type nickel/cobalt efflux system permease component RcnA